VDDTDDLSRAVRGAPEGPIAIEVRRNGTRRTLEARLGPKRDDASLERRSVRRLRESQPRVFEFHAPTPAPRWSERTRERDDLRREIESLRRELRRLERELEEQEAGR
jgi:hypothetical protein